MKFEVGNKIQTGEVIYSAFAGTVQFTKLRFPVVRCPRTVLQQRPASPANLRKYPEFKRNVSQYLQMSNVNQAHANSSRCPPEKSRRTKSRISAYLFLVGQNLQDVDDGI